MGVELVADRDTRTRFPKDIKLGNRLSDAFESESLILRCGDDRIGIGPSLCITHEEADELVDRLDRAITKVERSLPS